MLIFPTADDVAKIIIAAARACHADPEIVIGARSSREGRTPAVAHARAYAAFAIAELFPEVTSASVGRMVGAGSPDVYLSILRANRRRGIPWLDMGILNRVRRAASGSSKSDLAQTADPPLPAPAASAAPRRAFPVASPQAGSSLGYGIPASKRALQDMLREAVLNTARGQSKPE